MIGDVVQFLAKVPPFQFLDGKVVGEIAAKAMLEFYPKGTLILTQGGPPSDSLIVVVKGVAKVFMVTDGGEEHVIDLRYPGDVIGFLSVSSGDHSRTNVVALEDMTCYLIPRAAFLPLLDADPAIIEFFQRTFLTKYMDKIFSDMRSRSLLLDGGEKMLFTTTVGALATRDVVRAPQEITIRAAAELMSRHRISALVLTAPDGSPTGIVTDRDLRDKVVARGRDSAAPVSQIMSAVLIRADASEYCFEALLTMIRHNIHHLPVVEGGQLRGIITNHDLMMLQGTSPLSLVREIDAQVEIASLGETSNKVNDIVGLLLKEGARGSNICRIITEINDRLVRKVIEIVERHLGAPPLPYCWIAYGSEGRKEQTFRTDQDNALIWADPGSPAEEAAAREYFTVFTQQMKEGLVRCGFAPCPADFMAANPLWNQPLEVWKGYFTRWIATPKPDALLKALILFDFRSLAGSAALAEELRAHLLRAVKGKNIFLAHIAGEAIRHRPPLSLFGSFVVEKKGAHRNELDLKISALGPIVNIARLCALEAGVGETSTLDRLRVLRGVHSLVTENGEELEHAFEFLTLLRIHHQYGQLQAGRPIDNFLNPEGLSHLEGKTLRESFRLLSRVLSLVTEHYRGGLVGL